MRLNEQELKYISELLTITTKMLSAFNLNKLLNQILEASLELLEADAGSLMLIEESAQMLKIRASRGIDAAIAEKVHVKVGEYISGWVAKEGKPLLLVGGLKQDSRFQHLDENKNIRSSLSVPLKVENRVIGVLNVNKVNSTKVFTEADLTLASLLANQAAISIWNVKLYEEAKKAHEEFTAAQNQLIAREKMAALGQFSAGIAHEINNPLTAIIGNAQYLMDIVPVDSFGREEIMEIKEAAELASRIIARLFNYCSPQEYKQELVGVNEIITKITDLVKIQFEKQGITVVLRLSEQLSLVTMNPDELKEVLLNIILNAKQAMPSGGNFTIETKNIESTQQVEIVLVDTGCGIPESIIGKIFDPFFTTRRPNGAGLGLAICQRIIINNKGAINVASQPGKGTVFTVRLPYGVSRT
ncbi:MAG: ATP-binding protein [Candidatus Omnitrophota bacterium]